MADDKAKADFNREIMLDDKIGRDEVRIRLFEILEEERGVWFKQKAMEIAELFNTNDIEEWEKKTTQA